MSIMLKGTAVASKTAKHDIEGAIQALRNNVPMLVENEDKATIAANPFTTAIVDKWRPILKYTDKGRVDETTKVYETLRGQFKDIAYEAMNGDSRYSVSYVLVPTGAGNVVWRDKVAEIAAGGNKEQLDKLPQYTVTPALALNVGKLKVDSKVANEIHAPMLDRMSNNERQAWNRLKKKLNAGATGGRDAEKKKQAASAKWIDATMKVRSDNAAKGLKVGSAKALRELLKQAATMIWPTK